MRKGHVLTKRTARDEAGQPYVDADLVRNFVTAYYEDKTIYIKCEHVRSN